MFESFPKTNNVSSRACIGLFLLLLIALIPYCFFGFDVTDYGYILYNQIHATTNSLQVPLSNYLGGMLQKISLTGGLFEMKMWGAVIFCFSAVLILLIVKKTFDLQKNNIWKVAAIIFCFTLVALCPLRSGAILLPSYDSIPVLLYLLLVFCMVHYLSSFRKVFLFLSYGLFTMLVLSKITMIGALFVFAGALLVPFAGEKKDFRLQLFLFILFFFMALAYVGYFYVHELSQLPATYENGRLIKRYWMDLQKPIRWFFITSGFIAIGYFLERRKETKKYFTLLLILIGLYAAKKIWGALDSRIDFAFVNQKKYIFTYALTLFCMLYCSIPFFGLIKDKSSRWFVFGCAMILPCLCVAGSNTGLPKMGYGIVLMPAVLFAYWSLKREALSSTILKISLFIGLIAVLKLYTSYYRDLDDPRKLSATINHPKLANIVTSQERASSYQELLDHSKDHLHKNDLALAYDYNPMFYWLTDSIAVEDLSWPHLLSVAELSQKASNICSSPEFSPKIIVRTVVSAFDKEWPSKMSEAGKEDMEKFRILDEAVMHNCIPEKIWSNGNFEIWKPTI